VGAIAGGLGTAFSDALGYPQWMLASFLVHGFQGWLLGSLAWRQIEWRRMLIAVVLGGIVMVGGYFVATLLMGFGLVAANVDIPANIVQALVGGLVGVPLYLAVRRAYPPLAQR
jgi:uncharacterized membrane protein